MIVFRRFVAEPHPCAYLPERQATLEYSLVLRLAPEEYEEHMNRGFRKFGLALFQPVCDGCRACRPIRIPVAAFKPDHTQRKTARRNGDLRIAYGPPQLDGERLALYDRYHRWQAVRKGWPEKEADADEYRMSFLQNPIPAVEITLWEGEALRAVVLTEVTPNVVSGIYHYHDPDCAKRSIGTFCMLQTIELARRLDRPYAYFGYYVAGSPSMAYKANFRPCELMGEDGVWRPM